VKPTSQLPDRRGRAAFVFEEPNFDIDLIIGLKNIKIQDPEELIELVMQGYDTSFRSSVQPGDMLVGGENFGYGHPHPQAMRAMRHLGISCVISESFAPPYWMAEIGVGFPQISCPGILGLAKRWDELEVSWERLTITNLSSGGTLLFEPLSHRDLTLLMAGGMDNYLRGSVDTQEYRGAKK